MNTSDPITQATAYYQGAYGAITREDIVAALRRLHKRGDYVTLAELRALESAGLAHGYSVEPKGYPGASLAGSHALRAEGAIR